MIDALIAGRLHGKPSGRTASNGNLFATAKVRVPTRDGEALFVNVIAFDENVVSALIGLSEGDSVALSGELTPRAWTDKEGTPRPALDLLAHHLTSPYCVKRKRRALAAVPAGGELPFGDQFPGAA
jgi:single-stranded DNA-binding protein